MGQVHAPKMQRARRVREIFCRRRRIVLFPFGGFLNFGAVSKKSPKIAALIEGCQGRKHDAHYLGFFECFNRGLFYEAHEVLEELWLPVRHGPEGHFYQGLIQLAGAFVHLQKDRLRPAATLFKRAQSNLEKYRPTQHELDVNQVLELIRRWLAELESSHFTNNPLSPANAPSLHLMSDSQHS